LEFVKNGGSYMTVEFKPGYYEWNVFVDGNIFYTFEDFTEDIPYPLTRKNLIEFCEDMISVMKIDLSDNSNMYAGKEYDPFILIVLEEEMKKEIWYRYS
jgi:hypothetical protein